MKREVELKDAAMKELRRQLPSYLVLLLATAGAPDRAIVGNGRTSFWEMKHGTPDFASRGNQTLFCMRLDSNDVYCRYVIWQDGKRGRRTLIVHPLIIHDRTSWDVTAESSCAGFDHRWLVAQILKVHES